MELSVLSHRPGSLISVLTCLLGECEALKEGAPWPLPSCPLQLLSSADHVQRLCVRGLPTAPHPAGDHHLPADGRHPAVRVAGLHHPPGAPHGAGPQVPGLLVQPVQKVPRALCVLLTPELSMHWRGLELS